MKTSANLFVLLGVVKVDVFLWLLCVTSMLTVCLVMCPMRQAALRIALDNVILNMGCACTHKVTMISLTGLWLQLEHIRMVPAPPLTIRPWQTKVPAFRYQVKRMKATIWNTHLLGVFLEDISKETSMQCNVLWCNLYEFHCYLVSSAVRKILEVTLLDLRCSFFFFFW